MQNSSSSELWLPLARFLHSDNFRLTKLVIRDCYIDERSILILGRSSEQLTHLSFLRCTFPAEIKSKMFNSIRKLHLVTLSFIECECVPIKWVEALCTLSIRKFTFVATNADRTVLTNIRLDRLEYLAVESLGDFRVDLEDLIRLVNINSSHLVGLSLRGLIKDNFEFEKLWITLRNSCRLPQLNFLDMTNCHFGTATAGSLTVDLALFAPKLRIIEGFPWVFSRPSNDLLIRGQTGEWVMTDKKCQLPDRYKDLLRRSAIIRTFWLDLDDLDPKTGLVNRPHRRGRPLELP